MRSKGGNDCCFLEVSEEQVKIQSERVRFLEAVEISSLNPSHELEISIVQIEVTNTVIWEPLIKQCCLCFLKTMSH